MPSRPPMLKQSARSPAKVPSWAHRKSRQERGYGRAHDLMREQVLREEPLCRECAKTCRVTPTTIADHIVPKAEGGSDERGNYQGLCRPHHDAKTKAESARGARRAR